MDKTFSQQMNELSSFIKGYTPLMTVKPTIEAGEPSNLISFHGEHPEPYSDEQLKAMERDWFVELSGFVGCSVIIASIFIGLVLIL